MDNKMIITNETGSEIEVEVITTFSSRDASKQYIMYTKNEKQNENTIVYTSIIKKEESGLVLDEITDDNEWVEVKAIIKELLS